MHSEALKAVSPCTECPSATVSEPCVYGVDVYGVDVYGVCSRQGVCP